MTAFGAISFLVDKCATVVTLTLDLACLVAAKSYQHVDSGPVYGRQEVRED